MIDLGYVKFFDEFLEIDKEEYEKQFKKACSVLNKFLKKSLNYISDNFGGRIGFESEIISDYALKSNFKNFSNVIIKINYLAPDALIKNSLNKSAYKRLKDQFIVDENRIMTPNEVITFLRNELGKEVINCKTTSKNNILLIKIYDIRFYVVVDFNIQNSFHIFKRKYDLDFSLLKENYKVKDAETNGNFTKVIRFLKNIEVELAMKNMLSGVLINKMFVYENILFNVPSKLFCEEFTYLNYLNAITFLRNSLCENFVTLDGKKLLSIISEKEYDRFLANNKIFTDNVKQLLQLD